MIQPVAGVPLVIGVTGHRDLVASEIPVLEAKVELFLTELADQFPKMALHVITPLAEGADRLTAKVAHKLGIALTVLLPMPKEVYQTEFDSDSKSTFEEMLNYGELVELPILNGGDPAEISQVGTARDAQYEYLGVYLAAHSHILLALWDGKPSSAPGGTAHVVQFHQTDEVEIIAGSQHRSPIDFSEDESDLVYHIACSRQKNGAPTEGLQPGQGSWLSRDDLDPRGDSMPLRYAAVFQRHSSFNTDLNANMASGQPDALADYSDEANGEQLEDVHALYQQVDELAIRFQTMALRSLRWMFTFVALTGVSFIVYADFSGFDFGIYLYLLFMSIGISLFLVERRGDYYRKYLDYRVLAEGLRVQFYWALAGVPAENPSHFSHDNFMKRQDLEIGWIRNIMRYAGRRADAVQIHATKKGLQAAINNWVGDTSRGQMEYYKRRAAERSKRTKFTNLLGSLSFALGLLIAFFLAVGVNELINNSQNILIALMGALPFLAAVRQSYAHRVAERELIAQYTYMERIFGNAHRLLARTSEDLVRRDILRALGEAAMDENGLWIMRQRERPLSSGQVFHGG